jgi:elongation factor P
VQSYNGEVLMVALPSELPLVVVEVVAMQGGIGPGTKTMKLENGVEVKVPGFVGVGETIVVRTADASYMKRA